VIAAVRVTPAKAGAQLQPLHLVRADNNKGWGWVPAYAGMTAE